MTQLRFLDYELDLESGELARAGEPIELYPKPTALLVYLATRHDRFVRKEELLDRVWSDVAVSESALTSAVKQVRQALGPEAIENRRGRGYRFALPVEAPTDRGAGDEARKTARPTRHAALPFVGREEALEALVALQTEAEAGAARFAVIVGAPGIGKSRLIDEASRRAADAGWQTACVRCFEGPVAPALWPWTQLFMECAATREPDDLAALLGAGAADLLQAMPALAERLDSVAPPPAIEGGAARLRLHESVAGALARWAAERPLLVAIDDLHAADLPSLALLEFVARSVGRARLLVIGAFRDRTPHDDRGASLARLRGASAAAVPLAGLEPVDIAALLAARGEAAPDARVRELHEQTAGNPLFLAELIALGDAWAGGGTSPRLGLRDALQRHFEDVSTGCREVLTRAAFLGRDFDPALVGDSLDHPLDVVLAAVDEAGGVPLVEEHPTRPGLFRFVHALLPEVLAGSLGPAERVVHHAAIAGALIEAAGDGPDADCAAITHHLLEAAPLPISMRAFEIGRRAAQQAESRLAYEEAGALLERMLRAPSLKLIAEDRAQVLLDASRCHALAGDYDRARRCRDESHLLARRLDLPELFARAALGPFPDDEVGQIDHARALALEEALARLPEEDSSVRAQVLARLGMALHFSEDLERGRAAAAESVEIFRRLGDEEGLVHGLRFRHLASSGPEGAATRRERAQEVLDLARRTGSTELLGHGFRTEIETAHEVGDRDAFDRGVRGLDALADETRHPYLHWQATLLRSLQAWMKGDLAAAEARSLAGLQLGLAFQEDAALSWTGAQLFAIRRDQDRLAELEEQVGDMTRRLPEVTPWGAAWAFLQHDIGREDDAREQLYAMSVRPHDQLPKNMNYLLTNALLAEVAAALGERSLCDSLRAALEPYAGSMIPVGPTIATLGSVAHYVGLVVEASQGAAKSQPWFRRALAANEGMQCIPCAASSRFALARSLSASADAAERAESEALLRTVKAEARGAGLARLERLVDRFEATER